MSLITGVAFAHQDVVIEIQKDGTLLGLPKNFQPCLLKVVFDATGTNAHPIESLSFTLGKSTVQIPKGLLRLLRSKNPEDLLAHASWYHDETHLPYYLVIEFRDPSFDKNESGNPGFLMRFNLHTGKLFSMGETTVNRAKASWETHSISLSEFCTPSELAQFYDPFIAKKPYRR